MAAPEFIYLNEQAVRVTGWNREESDGTITIVVIAHGETERDTLLDLFSREPVMLRIGQNSAIPMDVRSLDSRTSGEGETPTYRIQVALWPEGSAPLPTKEQVVSSGDPALDKLDQIIKLLTQIRDEIRTSL